MSGPEEPFRLPYPELGQVGVGRQPRLIPEGAEKVPGAERGEGRQFIKGDVPCHVLSQEGACRPDGTPGCPGSGCGIFTEAPEKFGYEGGPEGGGRQPVHGSGLESPDQPPEESGELPGFKGAPADEGKAPVFAPRFAGQSTDGFGVCVGHAVPPPSAESRVAVVDLAWDNHAEHPLGGDHILPPVAESEGPAFYDAESVGFVAVPGKFHVQECTVQKEDSRQVLRAPETGTVFFGTSGQGISVLFHGSSVKAAAIPFKNFIPFIRYHKRKRTEKGADLIMITASQEWRTMFPGACFGVLVLEGVDNSRECPALEERKSAFETGLRRRHEGKSRKEIGLDEPFGSYGRYYKRFGQGYPVLHQVETVALKGKPLFSPSPLVAAMFMAELKNGFLTAGHDLDTVSLPLFLDVSKGEERYTAMGGRERILPPGDMFLSDREGILSSILYGPDDRTAVTAETTRVLYTVYGVPSLPAEDVRAHLEEIGELVRILSPEAIRKELLILG